MIESDPQVRFVLCVKNDEYEASLERRKVYESVPDVLAQQRGFLRVIDESGEDYLYPRDYFVPIELPPAAQTIFAHAS